jgi:ABC-2 type transport system permease protein
MKALLAFELKTYCNRIGFYIALLCILILGFFTGSNFNLSAGPDIFKNSPYTIAYMTGLLSLLCIFFTTIFSTQILFKEVDAKFELILFATPIRKVNFVLSRCTAILTLSFLCFTALMAGFAMGQIMGSGSSGHYTRFVWYYYAFPLLVFGFVNTLFCTAILCFTGWVTKNKLLVYVTGLLLYIAYMVTLIFSGSPLMAKSMPPSAQALILSAGFDPFGLSAYFFQTAGWSVWQRNTGMIPLTGILLLNRAGVLLLSLLLFFVAERAFSFSTIRRKKHRSVVHTKENDRPCVPFTPVQPVHNLWSECLALFSFTRINLTYIIKSIPFVLTAIALLFYLAMEIYGSIEKGIRLPQKYASSGLMAQAIIENFHLLCLLVILYYAHEIFWRSKNSHFNLIEHATPASTGSFFFSKWLTLSMVILIFSTLMIAEGIVFQWLYNYTTIDWRAYAGVYLFNALPLIISAGFILLIQKVVNHKYIGLSITTVFVLLTATSISKKILPYPLFRFQQAPNGLYSDLDGFGTYLPAYGWRYAFGISVVLIMAILLLQVKRFRLTWQTLTVLAILVTGAVLSGIQVTHGYQYKDKNIALQAQANYEQQYRSFQHLPQPAITDVITTVNLFPDKNAYRVRGNYLLKNKTHQPIDRILINFADGITIAGATLEIGHEVMKVDKQYTIVTLKKPLLPNDTASFFFDFSYQWLAVNGHDPFNAIIQNGSFMRISRYYPQFGYLAGNEITDDHARGQLKLGKATPVTTIDAPKNGPADFINLTMTISTSSQQTAVGVGELVQQWRTGNTNYFRYKTTSPIPFRFALSSAAYAVKKDTYHGKSIEIYYHPTHHENVAHLLHNARLTLDYCENNFGAYPFTTLRFAEVSAFTKGFAATAYPGSIFMTEDMIFHANISSDKKKDVINELAGHELSHIWWGNNQISPDDREGSAMLTETLAMYTELMLMKKMYGKETALERVKMHLGIYTNERGFSVEYPLYRTPANESHISYSKGMVIMYQLAEWIGEEKVNLALRNLLHHHSYPNPKPVSTDLIHELYTIAGPAMHAKIDDLFKKITLYDFTVNGTSVKRSGGKYELSLQAMANKYYEDGQGHRTKAGFTDTVDIAITLKHGKETMWRLPVINGRLSGTVSLNDEPASVLIDPNILFIKPGAMERLAIGQ